MEYYLSIKRNNLLEHVTTWMKLKNIIPSERIQAQKTTYCITQFI